MLRSTETVTLTWKDVNAKVVPPNRRFCRGPDPNAEVKQVLNNSKRSDVYEYHMVLYVLYVSHKSLMADSQVSQFR